MIDIHIYLCCTWQHCFYCKFINFWYHHPTYDTGPQKRNLFNGLKNLEKFGDDAFDVVADVAGHGERGAVADGERDVEALRDRLRQQCLAGAGGTEHHDVRFFKPKNTL
jgi:hypothetical protein